MKPSIMTILLILIVSAVSNVGRCELPPYYPQTKSLPVENMTGVGQDLQKVNVPLNQDLFVRTGVAKDAKTESVQLVLTWSNPQSNQPSNQLSTPQTTTLSISPVAVEENLKTDCSWGKKGTKVDLPDAALRIKINNRSQLWYVRPNLRRFHDGSNPVRQYTEILNVWNELPKASEHVLKLRLVPVPNAVDLYLDGSFYREIPAPVIPTQANTGQANTAQANTAQNTQPAQITQPSELRSCEVQFTAGCAYKIASGQPIPQFGRQGSTEYYPLDLSAKPRIKSFAQVSGSFSAERRTIDGVPAQLVKPNQAADVGICREGKGNWALEVDEYLMRQPEDAFPSAVAFRVPAAPYYKVWVAFALDTDKWIDKSYEKNPAGERVEREKVPVLTARLTKYVDPGVGINRIADTTVVFDDQRLETCKTIGTINKNGKTLPVYWTSIDLDVGRIIDQVANRSWREDPCQPSVPEPDYKGSRYLDFEFLGPKVQKIHQTDDRCKPDPNANSSVQILAATLQTAPAIIDLIEAKPGNIFQNGENARVTLDVKTVFPADGKLQWMITDLEGREVASQTRDIKLQYNNQNAAQNATGQNGNVQNGNGQTANLWTSGERVDVDLRQPVGFYWLDVSYVHQSGQKLYGHRSSFSILPRDERKAGLESPFTTWWFCGPHFVTDNLDVVGQLYKTAGFRSATHNRYTEAQMQPFNLSVRQVTLSHAANFNYLKEGSNAANAELTDTGKEAIDKQMKDYLAKYPSLKEVCIFHESCPGAIPYELYGQKHIWKPGEESKYTKVGPMVNAVGKFMRQKYPQIKLIVGNTGPSVAASASVCRTGADPKYIDALGSEATCQQFHPEKLCEGSVQSIHFVQENAKIFTGKPIRTSGCYEFSARTERMLGYQKQAQWYVRDALLCLTHDYSTISIASIIEPGNSYYNTLWGNGGLLHRCPYMNPKPSFHAMAVLTNVFDQVRFSRRIPTGSTTVYAVEFNRYSRRNGEGTKAIAFWTPRGQAALNVQFASNSSNSVRIIDWLGREQTFRGSEFPLEVGESPVYVVTDGQITAVSIVSRSFAEDSARAAKASVRAAMDTTDGWTISNSTTLDSPMNGNQIWFPIRKRGDFTIENVQDDQRGKCIQINQGSEKPANWTKFVTEYVRLDAAPDACTSFGPDTVGLGLWVKGNSNWGRILFEIEDADGDVWLSKGDGNWGCDAYDWPGYASVNFDGWNFVAIPLKNSDCFDAWGPGKAASLWVRVAGATNTDQNNQGKDDANPKEINGKMKLRAIIVESFREKLDLKQFEKTTEPLRIRDFSTF